MAEPPDPTDALRLDRFLCFSLYAATHAMQRIYGPLLAELGLTYPQYLVLVVLWEGDGVTVTELGARLTLESSTLTPLLKRLEASGLVTRTRGVDDQRRVRIGLTPAGVALRDRAAPVPWCVFEASGLDTDDLVRLKGEVDALRERLLSFSGPR